MAEEIQEITSDTEQIEAVKSEEQLKEDTSNIKAQIEEKLDTKIDTKKENQNLTKEFKENINALKNLLNLGLVNQQQGQNLLNHIIRAALDSNITPMLEEKPEENFDKNKAFKEFEKENPKFFSDGGRSEILNYLKANDVQFDKDELSKIAKIVEQVEKSAIDRYLRKAAHEENLEKYNTEAKQRLKANAQKLNSDGKKNLLFTREQIGKMTSEEFTKNEKAIMDQLKKGLIK